MEERRDRPRRSAALGFERRQCVPAECSSFGVIFDQLHEDQGEFRYSDNAHSIAAGKKIHDVTKILVWVAGHDGNAIEGGLKNIVSTARHQAATDERDGSQ